MTRTQLKSGTVQVSDLLNPMGTVTDCSQRHRSQIVAEAVPFGPNRHRRDLAGCRSALLAPDDRAADALLIRGL